MASFPNNGQRQQVQQQRRQFPPSLQQKQRHQAARSGQPNVPNGPVFNMHHHQPQPYGGAGGIINRLSYIPPVLIPPLPPRPSSLPQARPFAPIIRNGPVVVAPPILVGNNARQGGRGARGARGNNQRGDHRGHNHPPDDQCRSNCPVFKEVHRRLLNEARRREVKRKFDNAAGVLAAEKRLKTHLKYCTQCKSKRTKRWYSHSQWIKPYKFRHRTCTTCARAKVKDTEKERRRKYEERRGRREDEARRVNARRARALEERRQAQQDAARRRKQHSVEQYAYYFPWVHGEATVRSLEYLCDMRVQEQSEPMDIVIDALAQLNEKRERDECECWGVVPAKDPHDDDEDDDGDDDDDTPRDHERDVVSFWACFRSANAPGGPRGRRAAPVRSAVRRHLQSTAVQQQVAAAAVQPQQQQQQQQAAAAATGTGNQPQPAAGAGGAQGNQAVAPPPPAAAAAAAAAPPARLSLADQLRTMSAQRLVELYYTSQISILTQAAIRSALTTRIEDMFFNMTVEELEGKHPPLIKASELLIKVWERGHVVTRIERMVMIIGFYQKYREYYGRRYPPAPRDSKMEMRHGSEPEEPADDEYLTVRDIVAMDPRLFQKRYVAHRIAERVEMRMKKLEGDKHKDTNVGVISHKVWRRDCLKDESKLTEYILKWARPLRSAKGLTIEEIELVPHFIVGARNYPDPGDKDVCTTCQDGFQTGELIRILPNCGCRFHTACVDNWFIREAHCPNDRGKLRRWAKSALERKKKEDAEIKAREDARLAASRSASRR